MANEVTYKFASEKWTATIDGQEANWISGKDGYGYSNEGIQVSFSTSGANGTSPIAYDNISEIIVTYNTNQNTGAGTIKAQIGSNEEKENTVQYSKENGVTDGRKAYYTTNFTYDNPESGNLKLTVTCSTNSIFLVSVTIVYDEPLKENISLSFKDSEYHADLYDGENSFEAPELFNEKEVPVTYSSSDEKVATVDTSTGRITLVADGTTTIKANFAGNEKYYSTSATYALTVTDSGTKSITFSDLYTENSGDLTGKPFTVGYATIVFDKETGSYAPQYFKSDTSVHFYPKNTMTVSSETENIIKVVLTFVSGEGNNEITTNEDTYTNGTWTGNAKSVTFTVDGTSGHRRIATVTITYRDDSNIDLKNAGLEVSSTNISMNAGTKKGNFYSVKSDGEVTFSSTDEEVAKVEEDVLYALTPGTATITIKVASTNEYRSAELNLNVTVTANEDVAPFNPTGSVFRKVTTTEGIVNGEYLIVCESENVIFDGSLEILDKGGNIISNVNIENDMIVGNEQYTAATFTIDVKGKTLKSASNKYVGCSSKNNGMNTNDEPNLTNDFSIDENGNAIIKALNTPTDDTSTDITEYVLMFNSSNGENNRRFRYYANTQKSIQLYRLQEGETAPATMTIGATGWRTLVASENVRFPETLKAYIATDENEGVVTLTRVNAIKKGEAILINGKAGDYTLEVVEDANCDNTEGNLLKISEQNTTEAYVLANGNKGIGFYKWTGGWLGAGRVYLPVTSGAQYIAFNFNNESTGISQNVKTEKGKGEIYNLNGQRVQTPTKGGIYVVDGKKVFIK